VIVDILVAEIGSTITKISIFDGIHEGRPRFLCQGTAPTSVAKGDVTIGLNQALQQVKKLMKTDVLEAKESFACSSAAGGLRMCVHGLVYEMTVKAAKEAALGAGANLQMLTAGFLRDTDLKQIKDVNPNIIMISGGVDYGETETGLENARQIAKLKMNVPVIFAGNIVNREAVQKAFSLTGQEKYLYITDNVYPKIDQLAVEPARKIIQDVFEEHITRAPGMEKVRNLIKQTIIPTPGAVLKTAIVLQKALGDLVVADVGGATTDIHSVTEGNPEIQKTALNPEPFAKRTVEGDLGVYVNRMRLIQLAGREKMEKDLHMTPDELGAILVDYQPVPQPKQVPVVEYLTSLATSVGLMRHVGHFVPSFGTPGKSSLAEGKDLTNVTYFIGTGGALTRLPSGKKILSDVLVWRDPRLLLPKTTPQILIDSDYIMAAVGAFAEKYPEAAVEIMKTSFRI
jgi:uncharacterized protein (TIGR01319 family)